MKKWRTEKPRCNNCVRNNSSWCIECPENPTAESHYIPNANTARQKYIKPSKKK